VQALHGDGKGAAGRWPSPSAPPATERRSRAITLARLAELQLRQGHLDEHATGMNSSTITPT